MVSQATVVNSGQCSGIHSKSFTFAAYSGKSNDPAFNPQVHFAIRYGPRHCIGIDGQPADLSIPPGGLSGTAVWNIPWEVETGGWAPDDARIVGMVQKWDQDGQCLIAIRMEPILPFLDSVSSNGATPL
jgi:hypothetical protein